MRHFLLALQFFSRIPVAGRLAAWVGFSPAMQQASVAHLPGVGWVVGGASAGVLALALQRWGAQPAGALVAALLALAVAVWLTGGLHEDGLADACDGLGGSADRARVLEIMKDSRIGSYGALALCLSQALRAALLALLAALGAWQAAVVWLAAQVCSRTAALLLMRVLPYAREGADSKAAPLAAQRLPAAAAAVGLGWALPAVALLACALGVAAAAVALLACALAWAWMRALLARRLQGHTGDALGAVQQVCELALLLGAACALG